MLLQSRFFVYRDHRFLQQQKCCYRLGFLLAECHHFYSREVLLQFRIDCGQRPQISATSKCCSSLNSLVANGHMSATAKMALHSRLLILWVVMSGRVQVDIISKEIHEYGFKSRFLIGISDCNPVVTFFNVDLKSVS